MIEPNPDYNIGNKPVTHRQAANAIFNKLGLALSSSFGRTTEQEMNAIKESLFLADAIVREQSAKDEGTQRYFEVLMSLDEVRVLGNQMAGLTKQQAEELRKYLVDKYGILPGCVEGLVWQKYGVERRNDGMSEAYLSFVRQFVVTGGPA